MPTHERRNLTPPVAVNAQEPLRWTPVGELGQWLLSVRNDVSRRIGRVCPRIGHGRRISTAERPSLLPEIVCP